MTIPPIIFSGTANNSLGISLQYFWDSGITGYRAARPSDFSSSTNISGGSFTMNSQVGISGQTTTLLVSGTGIGLGRIVAPTNMVSGVTGNFTGFQVNQVGAQYVQIPNLDRTVDQVTAFPPSSATITGQQGGRTGIGLIFSSNFRNFGYIQNVGTNPIYSALSGTASPANYSFILAGGTATGDGKGSSWTFNNYYGSVSVSGNSILYTAWEF